jgi:EAL domain-containing protein (putative c-di-GMP-specific phosphodiesterase class I)
MEGIGRWALRTACTQLAAWSARGNGRDLTLHVNLSASELNDPKLLDTVSRTLAETRLNPVRLCLEITERMVRDGGARADAVLRGLEEVGVQLCLANFGSPASIDLLTRYQFDFAKVGRDLVGGLDSPLHRARLVRGLLGMAKALGTTLIAERIERGDELDRIAALGILKVQGYATGRPVTGPQLDRLLASQRSWDFATAG